VPIIYAQYLLLGNIQTFFRVGGGIFYWDGFAWVKFFLGKEVSGDELSSTNFTLEGFDRISI